MQGNDFGRLRLPPWSVFGLLGGIVAFITTVVSNLPLVVLSVQDLCRIGPGILLLASLAGFVAFVILAATVGFLTGRSGGTRLEAGLSGLLLGVLSACALVANLAIGSPTNQRYQQLSTTCPQAVFQLGSTPPPGFTPPTPPPFIATPPPGFYQTPPAGAFGPPSGVVGTALALVGLALGATLGMAVATGTATLFGFVGAATRGRAP